MKRWSRLGTLVTATALGVLLPAAAWAQQRPGVLTAADEAVRRRPRQGFGLLGAFCCLAVVAVVVLAALMLTRRRRSGPR